MVEVRGVVVLLIVVVDRGGAEVGRGFGSGSDNLAPCRSTCSKQLIFHAGFLDSFPRGSDVFAVASVFLEDILELAVDRFPR